MGESLNLIITKTKSVIGSCQNMEQLLIAMRYSDLASKRMSNLIGRLTVQDNADKYNRFRKNIKLWIEDKVKEFN